MSVNLSITSIKPTSGLFATKNFKTKEGEDKKLPVFASYAMPVEFESLLNSELKAFCIRAYGEAMDSALDNAVKLGKESFEQLSLSECFESGKREFLITKKDIQEWLDSFAYAIISAAIATKAGLHIDSPKVVKKANQYAEIMLSLSARGLMTQNDIDAAIRVMSLLDDSGKTNSYSDNILTGITRKQAQLDAFNESKSDSEEIDF